MARLPNLDKDQLKPEDLKFYDVIADSRGGVRGPYGVLLHSPDLAARVAHTGSYVRYNLELLEALRETIIIATARGPMGCLRHSHPVTLQEGEASSAETESVHADIRPML